MAVVMLRQALGTGAAVEWPPAGGDTGRGLGTEVLVRRNAAPASPHRLRLVPWGTTLPAVVAQANTDHSVPVIWILRRSSVALRNTLRARGESYIDLTGAIHLALPWALIDRTDLPPVSRDLRGLRPMADPFADKSSLVLRTMLESAAHHRVWGVRELAGATGVGLATASDAVRALAERQLVTVTRHGRTVQVRLSSPHRVLETWTQAYDWRLNRGVAVQIPAGDLSRFVRRLPGVLPADLRWALTLQAGAALVAPHATWERIHVYVDVPAAQHRQVLTNLIARAGWAPGPSGRLVLLIPHYTTSAWHGMRVIGRLPVVSDLQLVLDLWHYPVRGREQAEHLLRYMWKQGDR